MQALWEDGSSWEVGEARLRTITRHLEERQLELFQLRDAFSDIVGYLRTLHKERGAPPAAYCRCLCSRLCCRLAPAAALMSACCFWEAKP